MEASQKDPAVTHAMALALMRQSLALLQAIGEADAARHQQAAIDALLQSAAGRRVGVAAPG